VFCSAQFRHSKPEPAIFLDCLEALDVAPADALFVDDKVANANGARAAGLRAHHYQGHSGLRDALSTHRLLELPA
jgi:HAD superfamily hydrolase (TIGR01509 family)